MQDNSIGTAGTGFTLLPGWRDRLAALQQAGEQCPSDTCVLPRSPLYYSRQLTLVADAGTAQAMLDLARERPIAFIGINSEFCYDRPGVVINSRKTAYDPSSIRPFVLALALAEPDDQDGIIFYKFVVDLRVQAMQPALAGLMRLPCCFVGHDVLQMLLCLFQLGLPEPYQLWDTRVNEKALHLGRNHKNYKLGRGADEADQARASEDTEEEDAFNLELATMGLRYGVLCPFAADTDRLQRSFHGHPPDAPFSQEHIEYAAASVVAAASLYPHQVQAATLAGILQHLVTVEMPWVTTNARMVWRGVLTDRELGRRVEQAAHEHLIQLRPQLADKSNSQITNPHSAVELEKFFGREGLLHLFRRNGNLSFDKELLDEFQDHHQVIPILRAMRRINTLLESHILTKDFVGADGRVHANFTQLGTHTGRQTSWGPNLLGLGRVFRPLIVPGPGRGLGEVDLSQIEVGIAGAVYHDAQLIEMFNTGDVYSAMAQYYYREDLPQADRRMPSKDFKKKHLCLRARMKVCTLGIIYGLTAYGLALRLKTSPVDAQALLDRFMGMFPTLARALAETPRFGVLCGYVSTVSGLRRYRAPHARGVTNWEKNWMTNHPVQGSAAVVFKVAGNRLDRLYQRYDAWLLVPLHDAYLFEAPLGVLSEVANLTGRVLCEAVQEYFPLLKPQVEINIEHPACWNKDSRFDSIERWIDDPLFRL